MAVTSTNIVVVNVTQTVAPTPSNLQQSGALISQGGTSTATNTLTLCTNLAGLQAILSASKALQSLSWNTGTVTATTQAPHGWTIGDIVLATIAGASPAGYNQTQVSITITGASTFTYPLVNNPGSETVAGTVTLWSESELLQMGTTYFAQNGVNAVYVLELGEGTPSEGVTALSAYITSNPNVLYAYLVPREWDNNSSFLSFLANFTAPSAKTYFFITAAYANRSVYTGKKCAFVLVESPVISATEFSCAAVFANILSYAPSSTSQVPPLSYAFLFGVTAYPSAGNSAIFLALANASVNWVGTGAEGGISNTILFRGTMQDGNGFLYWYAADWMQINEDLNLANEVINGSNSFPYLYYNQLGITRLQNRAIQTAQNAVTDGLGNGTVVGTKLPIAQFTANYLNGDYIGYIAINAEPFTVYTAENPTDYPQGIYRGLTCVFTPSQGFLQLIFNLNVTNILNPA